MREQEQYTTGKQDTSEQQDTPSDSILEALRPFPHFVVWKYVLVDGKAKKPPFDPRTGNLASPTNPTTWRSLQEAQHALQTGHYDGVGFVFAPDDPFTGTDLDECINPDGTMQQWAQDIVTSLQSYTEFSPSGTGLHILTRATIPHGRKIGNLEMYSEGRYFTLTGNHIAGTSEQIQDRQEEQITLYRSYEPVSHEQREHSGYEWVVPDTSVLEKAAQAKNGASFTALYRGDTAGFRSKSEADFTLILRLLYWTNDDIAQTKRLFKQSGLYYAEKTESPRGGSTYLDITIQNALRKRQRRT